METRNDKPLLEVVDLCTYFTARKRFFGPPEVRARAVDRVSFTLKKGEILCILGEKGAGRTTLAHSVARLPPATSGRVLFRGVEILSLRRKEMIPYRMAMQLVFPYASEPMNPRHQVAKAMREAFKLLPTRGSESEEERMARLLSCVGLPPSITAFRVNDLPVEHRQRVAIARSLANNPSLLICDEPFTAFDTAARARGLNLLADLRERLDLSYLYLTAEPGTVRQLGHRVAVMYRGRLVETGPVEAVFADPLHPYTQALLSAVPNPGAHGEPLVLQGPPADPPCAPDCCLLQPRCPYRLPECAQAMPQMKDMGGGRRVACFLRH